MRIEYDKGTLRFGELPPDFPPSRLPGALWDPRVSVYRAPGCSYRRLLETLEAEELTFDDRVSGGFLSPGPWKDVELRAYQEAALDAWEIAGRRGTIALPTGSGKTRLAIAAMARTRLAALCLVPTRVLLAQWVREIGKVYSGAVGQLGDGVREVAPVTVSTFESAWRRMPEIGNRFDLLVVDEAHHFGRGERDEALEMSVARCRLGLSATPPSDPETLERLATFVGPVVYELSIGDLAGRWLSDFDLVTVALDLEPAERREYEAEIALYRPYRERYLSIRPAATWKEFLRSAHRSPEGRRAVEAWTRARRMLAFHRTKREAVSSLLARHGESRVLVFTSDNRAAYRIAREHLVMPVTCDIGRAERREVLERFEKGELRALVSARVLNEGLDVPEADVAILVGGSTGEREYVQRIGRTLRPRPGKRARIFELVTRGTSEFSRFRQRRESLAARARSCV